MEFCHLLLKIIKFLMQMKYLFTNFYSLLRKLIKMHQKYVDVHKKSHPTLFQKKFILLYLEKIKFLVLRCGWLVTKLYSQFTFEQDAFKK